MDKNQKEQKRDKLTNEFIARINFLQQQIDNIKKDRDGETKKLQDEIDGLLLQADALRDFKIK